MSDVRPVTQGELHANMQEVEPGLFRAEYVGELNPTNPDQRAFPDLHVGTDPREVKTWVEQMARGLGYDRVIWDSLPKGM